MSPFHEPEPAACAAAWILLAAWTLLVGPGVVRRHPGDAACAGALVLLALAIRLAIPWGPLTFVDAERLQPLWTPHWTAGRGLVESPTLLALLRAAGFSTTSLIHFVG